MPVIGTMNGSSKRKSSNLGSIVRPNKKRTVYMDESEEEDEPTTPHKANGAALNGAHGPPGHKKENGHMEGKNAAQTSVQEQRKQLPIAKG